MIDPHASERTSHEYFSADAYAASAAVGTFDMPVYVTPPPPNSNLA